MSNQRYQFVGWNMAYGDLPIRLIDESYGDYAHRVAAIAREKSCETTEFAVKIKHVDGKPKTVTLSRVGDNMLLGHGGDIKPGETIGQTVDRLMVGMQ
jgi:hypothetical protein